MRMPLDIARPDGAANGDWQAFPAFSPRTALCLLRLLLPLWLTSFCRQRRARRARYLTPVEIKLSADGKKLVRRLRGWRFGAGG